MAVSCPKCETEIDKENFNVSTDIAFCPLCDENFKYGSLVDSFELAGVDLTNYPKYIKSHFEPHGSTLVYRKVSKGIFFLIPFTAIWSGGSMFGMYSSFVKNGLDGNTLFFLPFLFGTIVLLSVIFFLLFGKREITVDNYSVKIFSGVGSIGLTKKFDIKDFVKASLKFGNASVNNRPVEEIHIDLVDNLKTIKFGAFMEEESKSYFAAYLNDVCKNK